MNFFTPGLGLGCLTSPWLYEAELLGLEGRRIAMLVTGILSVLAGLFVESSDSESETMRKKTK